MMMQEEEIMVSVCCSVYNHERYLRKCLDGFVMQKTSFKYEVLIHDDASTDGSPGIIREYEEKYPDVIKPIYQKENQYSKGIRHAWNYQYPRAKGKYIALCEGDDYWTDENKLQKQFDLLESDPEASFCAHRVRVVNENGERLERTYPAGAFPDKMLSKQWIELSYSEYAVHTSSYFFRAWIVKQYQRDPPEFMRLAKEGDTSLTRLCALYGNMRFLDEEMSCYRFASRGSYTERMRNADYCAAVFQSRVDSAHAYDKLTDYRFHSLIEKVCRDTEFSILLLTKRYREALSPRYRECYRALPVRGRIHVSVSAAFPFAEKLYDLFLRK